MRLIYEKGVNGIDGTLNAKYYREFAGADAEVASIPTDDLADGSFVICTSGIVQLFDEASKQFNPMFTMKKEIPSTGLNSTLSASPRLMGSIRPTAQAAETPDEDEAEEAAEEEAAEETEPEQKPEEEEPDEESPEQTER